MVRSGMLVGFVLLALMFISPVTWACDKHLGMGFGPDGGFQGSFLNASMHLDESETAQFQHTQSSKRYEVIEASDEESQPSNTPAKESSN